MKLNWIKQTVIVTAIVVLCVGAIFQYVNTRQNNITNAVLVMAYQ